MFGETKNLWNKKCFKIKGWSQANLDILSWFIRQNKIYELKGKIHEQQTTTKTNVGKIPAGPPGGMKNIKPEPPTSNMVVAKEKHNATFVDLQQS